MRPLVWRALDAQEFIVKWVNLSAWNWNTQKFMSHGPALMHGIMGLFVCSKLNTQEVINGITLFVHWDSYEVN